MTDFTVYTKAGKIEKKFVFDAALMIAYHIAEGDQPSKLRDGTQAGVIYLEMPEIIGWSYEETDSFGEKSTAEDLMMRKRDIPLDYAVKGLIERLSQGISEEDKLHFVVGDGPCKSFRYISRSRGRYEKPDLTITRDAELEKKLEGCIEKYQGGKRR